MTYKLQLVDEAKVISNREVARKYGFDESLIRDWKKKEIAMREKVAQKSRPNVKDGRVSNKALRLGKPGRKPLNLELEEQLLQWIGAKRTNGLVVTLKQLKRKALELSNDPNFKASSGWADAFKKRYNLQVRMKTHQSQRLPVDLFPKIVSFFKYFRKTLIENPEIQPSDIYAMDETGIFFLL